MSGELNTTEAVAELGKGAATAALLSRDLWNLARLMEDAGAPEVALRTAALDIPALLALPPEQAAALLFQLRDAVRFFREALMEHPAGLLDREP